MSEQISPRAGSGLGAPGTASESPVVILTGMSGAGRSTTGNVLEDLGWYVIDNLPPQMLVPLAQLRAEVLAKNPGVGSLPIAVVVDARGRAFSNELHDAIEELQHMGPRATIIFLDATDEALVRRFESVRRPHPLQRNGRLLDGIQAERELLEELRSEADVVVDTSGLNVHQLSAKITSLFVDKKTAGLRLAVMSFGFKYGIPLDADFVFDMRFLPNPFWVPELRSHTGQSAAVSEFVLAQPGAQEFVDQVTALMGTVTAGYEREGRRYATIAVGCTGGKHRSVAVAEALAARLQSDEIATFVVHRDLGRE